MGPLASIVQMTGYECYMEGTLSPAASRGKMTITVKARNIPRAKELAADLQGWSSSSLREVLLTCGVWEEGARPLAPDKPRIVKVWDNPPQENGSLPLGVKQDKSSNTFAIWTRTLFDRFRLQRNGGGGELGNDPALPNVGQVGQEQRLIRVESC